MTPAGRSPTLPQLRYPGGTRQVRFLARPNRYLAWVKGAEGPQFPAHVPNPGRLRELLPPEGTWAHVAPAPARDPRRAGGPVRRTSWTLVNVGFPADRPRTLVSIDTGAARPLVEQALARGCLAPVRAWGRWRPEVVWGAHRYDHGVLPSFNEGARPEALLETKSSNLKEGRTALFPDAPTLRGTAHVRGLARFARSGGRAALLFLVQRDDVQEVRPYGAMDPAFARAVEEARRAGVLVLGRTLHVRADGVCWGRAVPVRPARWEPARDLPAGRGPEEGPRERGGP